MTLETGLVRDNGGAVTYTAGSGWSVPTEDWYEFFLEVSGIKAAMVTIGAELSYEFYNTASTDFFETYGSDLDADGVVSSADYVGVDWDVEGGVAGTRGINWAGSLGFDLYTNIAIEKLLSITFNEHLSLGLSLGELSNTVYLKVALDSSVVSGLTTYLNFAFDMSGAGETVMLFTFPEVPTRFLMPLQIYVAYYLDLSGLSLKPYLDLGADLGGMLSGGDEGQDATWNKRTWYLKIGADLGMASDKVKLPFYIIVTNNGNMSGSGYVGSWYCYYLPAGYNGSLEDPLSAKLLLGFGLKMTL
jgi:hypothetical protein